MNTRLDTHILGFIACAAVALSVVAPATAAAQSTPEVLYACFVPNSGTVYRVKGPDLKDDCNSHRHVLFSWNQQGVPGEQGAQGIQGPQGEAGPVGPTGAAGAQGEAGPAGPQGEKGDIGPSGVEGPAGPAGPQGKAGPAGPSGPRGPDGFTSFTSVFERTDCHPLQLCVRHVECPAGKTAIAGGWIVTNHGGFTNITMPTSYPYDADTWRFSIQNNSVTEVSQIDLRVSCIAT